MGRAVEVRFEFDALVPDPAEIGEAQDLVSAAVGENGALPAHEAVDAPRLLDELLAGPQVEMIRVRRGSMPAPISSRSRAESVLTVPCVPTGMNAGVSTGP